MFDLVADIERYPAFLPWCRSACVRERAVNEVTASLEIARGPIRKSLTTRNRMTPGRRIEMELVDGPFRAFSGTWRFDALRADGCRISLDLEFELANRILKKLLGPVFAEIADTMVDAFSRRARELHE